ncbi:MBL fold metallo-hydrolase [Segniliparus rugosus]|uniref:Metallo-beta-lactamase domain-containing protein n=1 Tax=Segniliparus rugosus (strain ATCC BAA-974 / DSM 45345 / CCUG 50838 / CIP 108380 / JCM 13579 / CDC 945) TaxID=679197 RepID=E5XPK9_SEGRC|nr:MBL fold metallo-hydrolase [Segniliparus rugosus]EFV13696.1 hypothetical protein HMPREF9336_01431 [Segniliparus rugosus ATCC BAA-974]
MAFVLGSATVTQLTELDPWFVDPREWFPAITDEQLVAAHAKYPFSLRRGGQWEMVTVVHNYVVSLGDKLIVLDTCIGNHKPRPGLPDMHMLNTDYLERFVAAGFDPDRVDVVASTHLHPDHCGWNTRLVDGAWRPTFPNALHLFHSVEFDYLRGLAADSELYAQLYADSVEPILESGKWELIEAGQIVAEAGGTRIMAVAAPGHTPGHLVFEIADGNESLLVIGDAFHHPFQIEYRDLPMFSDADSPQAMRTRSELLERCANEGARLLTAHFPAKSPVGVRRDAAGEFQWTGLS